MPKYLISDDNWSYFTRLFREFLPLSGISSPISQNAELSLRATMEQYIESFLTINEELNLSSIREPDGVLWKHFYDSFLVMEFLREGTVLDWGSGGGFPGAAILFWRKFLLHSKDLVYLLDSRAKKIKAVEEILVNMDTPAARYSSLRGEAFILQTPVDSVVMRAVAPPEKAILWVTPKIKNWFFFAGPEQVSSWRKLAKKVGERNCILAQISHRSLPNDLGTRSIVHVSAK